MGDLRVELLKIFRHQSFFIGLLSMITFDSLAVVGLLLDKHNTVCYNQIAIWLEVAIARLTLRVLIRCYIEGVIRAILPFSSRVLFMQKCLDLLDVFGFIWFAVGNLIVFDNVSPCIIPSRHCSISYSAGLASFLQIFVSYLAYFLLLSSFPTSRSLLSDWNVFTRGNSVLFKNSIASFPSYF
jgi:hypothetical protein